MENSAFAGKIQRASKVMSSKVVLPLMASIFCLGASHAAEDLPTQAYLPLDMAQKAANAALEQCIEDGYRVSVAVTDSSGVPVVILRDDGTGPHTIDSSSRKAYTAASLGRSTQELANLIAEMPQIQGLRDMNEQILILGGGLPVRMGDELVGGIGVGGAPGGDLDEACAQAGIDSLTENDE